MSKIINSIISVLLIVALFAGCSGEVKTAEYDINSAIDSLDTKVVASNDLLELSWNDDGKFVSLYDKKSKKIWSSVPYEYFKSGETSDNISSPLNIMVANAAKAQWDSVSGYAESVAKDRVSVKEIDNGIKVTYYFDNYMISVPVSYVLSDDCMKVSVDSAEIVEEGEKVLLSVSLAPFLCSTENTAKNSYLFVPSGSGGLMYADERAEGTRKYTAEVFGADQSRLVPEEVADNTKIYLPVYGVKVKKSALLAIIDKGAECAEIYAEAGNRRTGYSTVYPTFYLRGYDVVETDQWLWGYRDLNRISDKKVNTLFSVNFYPLNGIEADYNGMADKYKEYLQTDNSGEDISGTPAYSLNILGGVTYKSASFGIPHKELYTLTSFKEAEEIVTTLNEKTGLSSAVVLKGFTSTGIDVGKIGGGFKVAKDYGSKKDFKNLLNNLKEKGTLLSVDFDIVRFSKSSNGFSYMLDSAKSATLRTVNKYGINIPLRSYNEEEYRLLKRSQLNTAVDKLVKFTDKESINNVSLSTLSDIAYSDFDEEKYSIKGNMASQVSECIGKIKKSGKKVLVSNANSYAAATADVLLNVPENNGDYFVMDESVPFYQMVFCGTKPMYSDALNLSENIEKSVMNAVSTGVRFGFTVIKNYDMVCVHSKTEKLYSTKFSDVETTITDLVAKYSDFYESISGSGIESYEIMKNGITKTVFENGVEVYANHLDKEVKTGLGSIEPYGLKIKE